MWSKRCEFYRFISWWWVDHFSHLCEPMLFRRRSLREEGFTSAHSLRGDNPTQHSRDHCSWSTERGLCYTQRRQRVLAGSKSSLYHPVPPDGLKAASLASCPLFSDTIAREGSSVQTRALMGTFLLQTTTGENIRRNLGGLEKA